MVNAANLFNLKAGTKVLCLALLLLGLPEHLYGQGTIGETTTTMELQENLMEGDAQRVPKAPAAKPKANNSEEKQGIEKLEKTAQKLMQSMQSGRYDRADFSPAWNNVVPIDANFSDGINTMLKPVFQQFGRPEKLGRGKMAGANEAVFPVQFTKGTLNMTVSLDQQDKIVKWTLTPQAAPSRATDVETPSGTDKTETQTNAARQSKNANIPDVNDFNAFQKELNLAINKGNSEESQWLGRIGRKAELAKTVDDVVTAELKFIRKVAEVANDEQTIKAIDLVLKQRQERLTKLTAKIEEELKKERQQQAAEKKTMSRSGSDQSQTERPRERPQRKPRETPTDGQ